MPFPPLHSLLQRVVVYSVAGAAVAMVASAANAEPPRLDTWQLYKQIVIDMQGKGAASREAAGRGLAELVRRADAKEPLAMLAHGEIRKAMCISAREHGIDIQTTALCVEAFKDVLAVAENQSIAKIAMSPMAKSTLAEMYRDGIGTKPSRFVAADWFIRSAQQRSAGGDREGALRALEDALTLIPDHPAGLRLRAELFK